MADKATVEIGKRVRVYRCTVCEQLTPRDQLMVRKAVFQDMGLGGRVVRSRVTGWLCPRCVASDPGWTQAPFKSPAEEFAPEVSLHG